jgi:hypothetical protein
MLWVLLLFVSLGSSDCYDDARMQHTGLPMHLPPRSRAVYCQVRPRANFKRPRPRKGRSPSKTVRTTATNLGGVVSVLDFGAVG